MFRPTCRSSSGWMKKKRYQNFFYAADFSFFHCEGPTTRSKYRCSLKKCHVFICVLSIHEESIYTYWMLVKDFIYVFFCLLYLRITAISGDILTLWCHAYDSCNLHMTAMTVVTLSFLVTSVYACSTSISCFVGVTDMTQAEKELWTSLEHLALRKKNQLRVLDYRQRCMICRISSHWYLCNSYRSCNVPESFCEPWWASWRSRCSRRQGIGRGELGEVEKLQTINSKEKES